MQAAVFLMKLLGHYRAACIKADSDRLQGQLQPLDPLQWSPDLMACIAELVDCLTAWQLEATPPEARAAQQRVSSVPSPRQMLQSQ